MTTTRHKEPSGRSAVSVYGHPGTHPVFRDVVWPESDHQSQPLIAVAWILFRINGRGTELPNRLYWGLGGRARLRTNLNGMRVTLEKMKAAAERDGSAGKPAGLGG